MGKIILARHGQDKHNAKHILNGRLDEGLTNEGIGQALCLANKVCNEFNIKIVVSSPLRRAVETARICALRCETHHYIIECLVERSHGILEGHHYSDIPKIAKSWKDVNGQTYVLEVEDGESYPELRIRAKSALCELKIYYDSLRTEGDMLVVSHGALIRSMLDVYNGVGLDDQWTNIHSLANCEYVVLDAANLTSKL